MFNLAMFADTMESLYKLSYDAGFYTNETIASFVKMGTIGPDAYKRITGEDYVAESTKVASQPSA